MPPALLHGSREVVALRQERVEVREHRPVLLPGEQVGRRGQAELGVLAVPRGVGQVVGAVDLGDPRVLAAELLVGLGRREHRLGVPLEVDAVVAGRQADVADDVVGVRAVEQHDLAVLHDGGRVVDARGLPAVALRAQDRVRFVGRERAEGEVGVRVAHGCTFSLGDVRAACGGSAADEGEATGDDADGYGARRDLLRGEQAALAVVRADGGAAGAGDGDPGVLGRWSRPSAAARCRARRRRARGG